MKLIKTSISLSSKALKNGQATAKSTRKSLSLIVEEGLRAKLGMPPLGETEKKGPAK